MIFSLSGTDSRSQEIFDAYRKLTDSDSCCVVDGGRDRRRDACQSDLADAPGSVLIQQRIRDVQEVNVYPGGIGDGGDDIVGKVAVDGMAVAGVIDGLFEQPHTDSHNDGACHLVRCCAFIDDTSAVDYADNPAHTQPCDAGVPFYLDKLCAKGVRGEIMGSRIGAQASASSAGDDRRPRRR